MALKIRRKPTRAVRVGPMQIGGGAPIAVQSMAATRTQDVEATLRQVSLIAAAGADAVGAMVESALEHAQLLDDLGFTRYVVSLKDSDWRKVVEGNRRFAAQRPDIPLHLGVTEAGMPPDGVIKTRIAFEQLLAE